MQERNGKDLNEMLVQAWLYAWEWEQDKSYLAK